MRKTAFIGVGGINSWAGKFLNELYMKLDINDYYVEIFDKDIVEEKNIVSSNQNYDEDDLMENKAEALAKKYGFMFNNVFITEDNLNLLDNFDDIIMGVDNNKVRKMVYEYCLTNRKYLLDLRAQGTQVAFYVLDHNKDMEYYNKLHFANAEVMDRKGSCQMQQDIEEKHVEMGNYNIACLGINMAYLKHIRGETLSTNEFKFVY